MLLQRGGPPGLWRAPGDTGLAGAHRNGPRKGGGLGTCFFLPLTHHPQLWGTRRGVHGPAPRHGRCHPDALPAWPGKPPPPPAGSWPPGAPSQCPPVQSWSLLTHQGRLLTLLDDSSLHLWEIIHHNGCAHLEEALSFQPPSRLGFDGARCEGTWPGTSRGHGGDGKLPRGWGLGRWGTVS